MKLLREILGYVLGGVLFVGLMPTVMWLVSGMPALWPVGAAQCGCCCSARVTVLTATAVFLMAGGLSLSVWTLVYMKRRGKGNPMDAFGHEVAPRTQHLMTDGPYRLNRNPMLTGTLTYLAGVCIWLWSWQAVAVWAAFLAVMLVQVFSEERRLRRDFGAEYEDYCRRTRRF